jgi:uncharacterized protein with GYD domain
MPTYVTLLRWTQKGIEAIKEGPSRLDAARKMMQGLGARLTTSYLVNGPYDFVIIVEAPDDETMTKVSLALASKGNVRTETLRAYTEEEYRKIIAGLPK